MRIAAMTAMMMDVTLNVTWNALIVKPMNTVLSTTHMGMMNARAHTGNRLPLETLPTGRIPKVTVGRAPLTVTVVRTVVKKL